MSKRNIILDLLKGIAIIAVVLYHWGIAQFGYLGVEIFLVISGYLVVKGLLKDFEGNRFSYWQYLNKRVSRLWPGLILITIIALALGWDLMLPLHYKLNCESAIGTVLFGNNFVQYITSGNYWTADNEYRPLMHTWYIGVLMQFYIVLPIIFIIARAFTKRFSLISYIIILGLSVFSLLLYLTPVMTNSQNFYLLSGRFFELGLGGALAIAANEEKGVTDKVFSRIFILIMALIAISMLFGLNTESGKLRLIVVVFLTLCLIWASINKDVSDYTTKILNPIAFLGVASYSIYLSHQVIFTFYKYAINNEPSIWEHIIILTGTLIVGVVLYYGFEKPISRYFSRVKRNVYIANCICLAMAMGIVGFAGYYYIKNGLTKDIPELDLYVGKNNQSPEDYNSRVFPYDKNFENNGKKNIMVVGDSFSRDWINIMLESGVDSVMNISYRTETDEITRNRIKEADYVFVANNASIFDRYSQLLPLLMNKGFYRIGIKRYGSWMGLIYRHKGEDQYFSQTVKNSIAFSEINKQEKEAFSEHYIDMMQPVTVDGDKIIVFTPEGKLITQDCLHLTKAGAKMYAEKLNVWQYLK